MGSTSLVSNALDLEGSERGSPTFGVLDGNLVVLGWVYLGICSGYDLGCSRGTFLGALPYRNRILEALPHWFLTL